MGQSLTHLFIWIASPFGPRSPNSGETHPKLCGILCGNTSTHRRAEEVQEIVSQPGFALRTVQPLLTLVGASASLPERARSLSSHVLA